MRFNVQSHIDYNCSAITTITSVITIDQCKISVNFSKKKIPNGLPPANASRKKTVVANAELALADVKINIAINGEMTTRAISMKESMSCGFMIAGSFC